jgi:alkanesulfonate monooxygenase SsuD/methylene tetrahydromethanopterin reductase-like flavin-dependent oxidoreductase (luciferase family)
MRIDVIIQSDGTAEHYSDLGRLAEKYGLGTIWVPNNANGRDAFVNFTPFALQSSKILMGPMAISPFELHPVKMGASLLSLNEISNGRAGIVVGAGGGVAENIGQLKKTVIQPMRECIEILNMMADGTAGEYKGEFFPVAWVDTRWVTQKRPMIYAGANKPKLVAAVAEYADGIMVSDFTPGRITWLHEIVDPILRTRDIDPTSYPINNFWAWHVKEDPAESMREARINLCVRGTLYDHYIHDVVDDDEAKVVEAHIGSFARAYYRKDPEIRGVPDDIVNKIVEHGTSASSLDNIEAEVERFKTFASAGLNEISLCLYDDPAASIKMIGEHIVPALSAV